MSRKSEVKKWARNPLATAVMAVCVGSALWMSAQAQDVPSFMSEMQHESEDTPPQAGGEGASGGTTPDDATRSGTQAAQSEPDRTEGSPAFMADMDDAPETAHSENVGDSDDEHPAAARGQEPSAAAADDTAAQEMAEPGMLQRPDQPVQPRGVDGMPMTIAEPENAVEMTRSEREYLDELRRLQQETELWELRNRVLEQQQAYSETQRKVTEANQPEPAGPSLEEVLAIMELEPEPSERSGGAQIGSAFDTNILEDERALAEMRLVSVFGDRDQPSAELFYGGGRMKVAVGDSLPGGWRVHEIDRARLLAKKGSRLFEIGVTGPRE